MKNEVATVEVIAEFLKEQGISVASYLPTEEIPVSVVVIPLAKDSKGRFSALQVRLSPSKLKIEDRVKEGHPEMTLLEILHIYPFPLEPEALEEAARMADYLNISLPFPCFGISEPDKAVTYRNVLTCGKTIDLPALWVLIAEALDKIPLYSEIFEEISSGRMSFAHILKEASNVE